MVKAWATAVAQVDPQPDFNYLRFGFWFGVVIFLVALTLFVMKRVRASALAPDSLEDDSAFDLERLCVLRDSGDLTSDEYTRLSGLALEKSPALELLTLIRELRDKGVLPVPEYEAFKERVVRRVKEEEDSGTDPTD